MIAPHNRYNPVSLRDPCYQCGGKWKVIPTSVEDRMDLGIGRHWIAQCTQCGIISVCKTLKQDKNRVS